MKKSDFLDGLRLEIGLAYDYAENKDDFMVRVLKTIHAINKKKVILTIHSYNQGEYTLSYALGMKGLSKEEEELGRGFLFINRLKAVTYVRKNRDHVLFLPLYEEGEAAYVITIKLIGIDYEFTKQDMIFADELIHFIESKRSSF
ncbi:hypothetical protein [Salipaludibacillus aurantiacus]|uniref:GAF domain-containing protein n=1 Tax=Salipaludibacillus aurantiacus TaxID=1601833 RepID=A0A1H9WZX1_9BACI|nr:hypothetical protein [Salipaludibacillus aurantiacus]SES39482.1 hypothetical protein SAMN05518684_12236 [Salipaludibacillus aurantiacus]